MTKHILIFLTLIFICAACSPYNQKNYKKYQGISYDQYEQDRLRKEAGNLSLDEENAAPSGPRFDFEYDAFGNEIVESVNSTYGEAVVPMASRKITLGRNATNADMPRFQRALDAAYQTAQKTYRPSGFTYSMSPAGTVNPLEIMDVQCLVSESSANSVGKDACNLFFREIMAEYQKTEAPGLD